MAGEPVVLGIVDGKPGLHAGELGRRAVEGGECPAELVGIGLILGVIDHQETPARERQRSGQRLGLGAGPGQRSHDFLERRAELKLRHGKARSGIVRLDHELHVQFFRRVIETAQRSDQPRHHVRFV